MRTLDLLRNHPWNAQAVIADRGACVVSQVRFEVRIEAIAGFFIPKTTYHPTEDDARSHAKIVVFGTDQ